MVDIEKKEIKDDQGTIESDEMDLSSGLADDDIMNDVEESVKLGVGENDEED